MSISDRPLHARRQFPFLRKLYGIDAGILTLAGMLVLLIVTVCSLRVNRNPLHPGLACFHLVRRAPGDR